MQYHYVVGYNTDTNKWFIEYDTAAYFPDGNVWRQDRLQDPEYSYYGWWFPDENSPEESLDYSLLKTLSYIVDTWPTPIEVDWTER